MKIALASLNIPTCVIYREGYLIDLWRENKKEREEVEKKTKTGGST